MPWLLLETLPSAPPPPSLCYGSCWNAGRIPGQQYPQKHHRLSKPGQPPMSLFHSASPIVPHSIFRTVRQESVRPADGLFWWRRPHGRCRAGGGHRGQRARSRSFDAVARRCLQPHPPPTPLSERSITHRQVLSTRVDLFPEQYTSKLRSLQVRRASERGGSSTKRYIKGIALPLPPWKHGRCPSAARVPVVFFDSNSWVACTSQPWACAARERCP